MIKVVFVILVILLSTVDRSELPKTWQSILRLIKTWKGKNGKEESDNEDKLNELTDLLKKELQNGEV